MIIITPEEVQALRASADIDAALAPFVEKIIQTMAPCHRHTLDGVAADFKALQGLDAVALISRGPPPPMKRGGPIPAPLGSIPRSNVGCFAADAWQARERWRARYMFDPPPVLRWHDRWYMAMQLRHCVESSKVVTIDSLRAVVSRMGYTPAQFSPAVAKAVIDWCGARIVIDPCAGWGDRLVGALASSASYYIGIDTNRGLHWGYGNACKHLPHSCEASFLCDDATDSKTWDGLPAADLVLTSPPHAHFELYADGYNQPETAEAWGARFATPLAQNAHAGLRSGGVLAIHLCNVRIRQKDLYLVPAMMTAAATTPLVFLGSLGVLTRSRSRVEGAVSAACEPILLWRKP